ncbi:MAG: hypothetical protein M3422_22825, partial [Actinomycetota bacterium]|nr:hypothetical protein [Actinomycetota bacterium]
MRNLKTFQAALGGDDAELREQAGPGALICLAPELSSAFVVWPGADGTQNARVAIIGTEEGGGNALADVHVPTSFPVISVERNGGEFVLTSADGRTVHGTPEQFAQEPLLLVDEDDPRYTEQRDQLFYETHLRPLDRFAALDMDSPETDIALSNADAVAAAGEAMVAFGDDEVWLNFECAGPEKVMQQIPHARGLLADLTAIGRAGAEFVWSRTTDEDKAGIGEDAFFELMTPSSLVVHSNGDFVVHYERTSDVLVMDGYWIAVQFDADRTPVD